MARAIGLEIAPRDPREELRKRLEAAPEAHAEALLEGYELLQELHDAGILRVLRGAASACNTLIETAVDAAKSEEAIRAQRNALIFGKMLGSIDPDVLQGFAVAVSETFDCQKSTAEPPGLLKLLGAFREPELRRSMTLINKFLATLGNELKTRGECR
jgi:uncharacterized protein YjgD (DUF1641 family)